MKKIFVIISVLIFAGCSSSRYVTRKKPKIIKDKFSNDIKIVGVTKKYHKKNGGAFSLRDVGYYYFLRSFVNKKNLKEKTQLYVEATYMGDWKFFNSASFKGGKSAKFISIDQEVTGCTTVICAQTESFGVLISRKYLNNHKDGFKIKVYAKSGDSIILNLSKKQVDTQLAKLKKLSKKEIE